MRHPQVFLNTILGVVIAAGCTPEQPGPTDPGPLAASLSVGGITILSCTPLPIDSASAVVGKDGGTISVGPHTLVIPAGALKKAVTITARTGGNADNAVQFGPEGLLFSQPASLTMSYANCSQWGQIKKLLIVYTDDSLNVLEVVSTTADNTSKTVTGSLQHFSQYAVAY